MATLATIICNYNHGRFVSRAIEAMLTQSRPADEFIIVDDGSTDDSVEVIRSWVQRHPFIQFLQNDKNLGFHASLLRAIKIATSDFIYSGAADDHVLPDFFRGAMQLAEAHPSVGVISGQFITHDSCEQEGRTFGLSCTKESVCMEPDAYLRNVLMKEEATLSLSGATIFRRLPLLEIGGQRAELGSWGDTFSIQAIGLRYGFCYWSHPAMIWTVHRGSLSQTTRSDPLKGWLIADRAAGLMRSEPFRDLFPADYVARWKQRFQQAIVHEQLSPVIEGYQAIQTGCQTVAETASLPTRLLLKLLRTTLQAIYFVTFRVLRMTMTRRLVRQFARNSQSSAIEGDKERSQ